MHCFLELLASNPFYLHFLLSCSPAVLLLWVQGRPILPGPLGTGCSHWPSACHVVVHKKWYMLPLIAASNCKGVCAHQRVFSHSSWQPVMSERARSAAGWAQERLEAAAPPADPYWACNRNRLLGLGFGSAYPRPMLLKIYMHRNQLERLPQR